MQGKAGHYNGEMVAGALLEKESKILAQLMLEGHDEATLKKRLFSENLLQKRSQQTIKRQVSLIKNRLTTLYPDAWKLIAKGSSEAANQALLAGAIKNSRLLGDFLQKVIKGHISLFHKHLGPGLLESVYEESLCYELELQQIRFQRQITIPAVYKNKKVGEYRLDLLVENAVIVEIKSVDRFDPVFEAQILTYLRLTEKKVGLLINFNSRLLKDGVKRYVL